MEGQSREEYIGSLRRYNVINKYSNINLVDAKRERERGKKQLKVEGDILLN